MSRKSRDGGRRPGGWGNREKGLLVYTLDVILLDI